MTIGYAEGVTPLMVAAECSSQEIVEYIIAAGASLDAQTTSDERDYQGWTALHYAVDGLLDNSDCFQNARVLLEAGAEPDIANGVGNSPLLLALQEPDETEMINLLLEHGSDPLVCPKDGDYPAVHEVAGDDALDFLKQFLDGQSQVDFRCGKGTTPLMCAANRGEMEAFAYLVNRGADVAAVDNDGKSVLFYAANFAVHAYNENMHNDAMTIFETLVKNGAPVGHKDKNGDTVMKALKLAKDSRVSDFLKKNKQ